MNNRIRRSRVVICILIILSSATTLCYSNESSEDFEYEPLKDQHLDTLYFGTQYFLPYPPSSGESNKTTISALNRTTFSHNLRDRKFNSKIKPELNLWLDAAGTKGIELEFEINFQAVEDLTELPDKTFKITFQNYTTNGSLDGEVLNLTYLNYEREPFDIKSGADNWCLVYLIIRRTDNITGSKVTLYCGAEDRVSNIKIPYSQTLSAYNYEQEKDNDMDSTPGFTGLSFLFAIVLLISINYLRLRFPALALDRSDPER